MTKTLLGVSISGIALGVFFVSGAVKIDNSAFFVVLPAGAIFFGLFLISRLLEKESAVFDQEQAQCFAVANAAAAPSHEPRNAKKECSGNCGCEAKATHAHAHAH